MDRKAVDRQATLAQILAEIYVGISKRSLKQMVSAGRVTVDGSPAGRLDLRLSPGAVVEVGARARVLASLPTGLEMVHEDGDVLVVVKGHGLLTMATATERERTAYAYLTAYVESREPRARVFIVHRLDREASGLLVFARTASAKSGLQEQFRAHTVERLYAALVEGRPKVDSGVIDLPLLENDKSGRVHVAAAGAGRDARTHFRVIEGGADCSLLEVRLETGRKHQIRVHLQAIGHPIVGDTVYGSKVTGLDRLALHARTLGFVHPRTGEAMRFESEVPRSFRRIAKREPGKAAATWTEAPTPERTRRADPTAPRRRRGSA